MIGLRDPAWLLLVVPLAAALWYWRLPTRLLTVMRAVALLAVLGALAGLAVRLPSRAGTVVVMVDRSLSMPVDADERATELIQLLERAKGTDDRLAVLAFGRSSAVEMVPGGQFGSLTAAVGPDASNYHDAMERALALIDPEAPGRVLVIGDGRWTGADPAAVAARAMGRGVAIDHRLLERPTTRDVAIARVDAPPRVAPGEGYTLTAWVRAPVAQQIAYELLRGNTVIARGTRRVDAGANRLVFRDRAAAPGVHNYRLRIGADADDPVPENNTARLLVGIDGKKPVLHLAPAANSQLARLLRDAKIDLELDGGGGAARDWSLATLAGYSAVLIENVTWQRIGEAGMANLEQWVRQTGAGVMMTGGQTSYGPGGYFESPIEAVLPVSMELRREHRKLSLAIVITMDRSGSMSAGVTGGKTKMDLANAGAAQVVELLSPMDEIGVWAVDSSAHKIVDLQTAANKAAINSKIRRIQSMGGGIFVYEALKHAVAMINGAQAGTRHIVLFSDAQDSEQPGDYAKLVDAAAAAGVTFSVIGLGKPTDVDADLLRDIARRGNGRAIFNEDAKQLPRLFAQDTFVVARNTFIDEPTEVRLTGGLTALTGRAFAPRQMVGGYNLTYLKPRANAAAITQDQYDAPLIAWWQAGTGRAVAYTGEADGEHTGPIGQWADVGEMFASLVRYTAGDDQRLPGGAVITQQQNDGRVTVRLHLDARRQGEALRRTPELRVLRGAPNQPPVGDAPKPMRWVDADTLAMDFELRGDETAIAAVALDDRTVAQPPVTLAYSPEFAPVGDDRGRATLGAMSRATGGRARDTVEDIWAALPRQPRLIDLSPWLLLGAVMVFLLEVFERRSGLLSVGRRRELRQRRQRVAAEETAADEAEATRRGGAGGRGVARPAPEKSAKPQAAEDDAPASTGKPEATRSVFDAMQQARDRARGRTGRKP